MSLMVSLPRWGAIPTGSPEPKKHHLCTKGVKRLFLCIGNWLFKPFLCIYLRVRYAFGGLKYSCCSGDMEGGKATD